MASKSSSPLKCDRVIQPPGKKRPIVSSVRDLAIEQFLRYLATEAKFSSNSLSVANVKKRRLLITSSAMSDANAIST